ncbi:MAG: DUF2971 domain-containing protein [Dysgonamonadaceae bacterium]|jgi:hypothetical protein|nr:DUF2971 domain-containing protein [Dysgonamonadaceae bacterium]
MTKIKNNYSLYYYSTAETLLKILGGGDKIQIKYSDFNKSNDPKERLLYRHFQSGDIPLDTDVAKEKIRNEYKYISFCRNEKSFLELKESTFPVMWAIYGSHQSKDNDDNQTYMDGVCIEIDFDGLKQYVKSRKKDELILNKIRYIDSKKYLNLYSEKSMITIDEDIIIKWNNWKYENEYRIIYNGEDEFLDITNFVERIYLGEDFRLYNVVELCKIMATKRYDTLTPSKFTKIIVNNYRRLDNINIIQADMIEIIRKEHPDYYDFLVKNVK